MKKTVIFALSLIVAALPVIAQNAATGQSPAAAAPSASANSNATGPLAPPNPADLGNTDTAQQALQEISISKFEDPGFWNAFMPVDEGVIESRRFEGAPADRQPIPGEQQVGISQQDKYVLGVKAQFYRRADVSISIAPVRPLAVPGIVKTVSVWVVGRNFNHLLKLVVQDQFGNVDVLPMGMLNFTGWRKLTVAIPPNIDQRNFHYPNKGGINILGFVIDTNLTETYGSYYIYFDDLRAVTDLFADQSRDKDDIPDNW